MLVLASCGRLGFDAHGDGGVGSDAPLTDGGVVTCNAITRIADDFSLDRRNSLWSSAYFDGATSAQVINNALVLHPEANAAMTFVGFQTGHLYDLRGRRTSVELCRIRPARQCDLRAHERSDREHADVQRARSGDRSEELRPDRDASDRVSAQPCGRHDAVAERCLSLIHISEPTRR